MGMETHIHACVLTYTNAQTETHKHCKLSSFNFKDQTII